MSPILMVLLILGGAKCESVRKSSGFCIVWLSLIVFKFVSILLVLFFSDFLFFNYISGSLFLLKMLYLSFSILSKRLALPYFWKLIDSSMGPPFYFFYCKLFSKIWLIRLYWALIWLFWGDFMSETLLG